MRKLEINYDLIDKVFESKGQHKIRRLIKHYKMNDILTISFIAKDAIGCISGQMTPVDAMMDASSWIIAYAAAVGGTDYLYKKLKESRTGMTREEEAEDELRILALRLNDLNISVNLDELKEASIYHKKYILKKDGVPGVIRERYINIPVKNTGTNSEEKNISIKEEHIMGTRSYELTVDTPKKELVYKPVYNV